MKNKLTFLLTLLIFLCVLSIPTSSFATQTTSNNSSFCKVRISVFDEQNQPIDMATICIVETQEYFSTSRLGQLELSFSIESDKNIFKKTNWKEFTLLIYKNGYRPHILYGLKAIPNINRTGIVITLKDTTQNKEIPFTQSYDYPTTDFSSNIINQFKK